jgi:hypothetical protein
MWKLKLKEWGFIKHIAAKDMQIMVAKAEQRDRKQNKDTVFYQHGQVISHERLEHFKRRKTTQSVELASPSAGELHISLLQLSIALTCRSNSA